MKGASEPAPEKQVMLGGEHLRVGAKRRREGQAGKGAGRMPWHQEPKKDVISCEKPRGAANEQ